MNHHYAKAIDILMRREVDFKSMCIELAKQNPELFCSLAAGAASAAKDNAWQGDAIQFMRNGNMVGAIKLCREKTGFGLKEAKDVIDAVRTRDSDIWFTPAHLYEASMAVYKEMIGYL